MIESALGALGVGLFIGAALASHYKDKDILRVKSDLSDRLEDNELYWDYYCLVKLESHKHYENLLFIHQDNTPHYIGYLLWRYECKDKHREFHNYSWWLLDRDIDELRKEYFYKAKQLPIILCLLS
ncbi:hypothetical protein [Vibrio coralliilyticus]|uniref:hypothetical protein n=1 Tax=Vibrio coralliilyticus TaxID=190893 RepID=UPI00148DE49A|nr:hypothetical protein [Vibrio coralliilyticus]NOI30194.1 hypothetical protein [Vibrio coralliilyticus]NOI46832.1 hypothetical protein [Vibrio coralliilyticus]